MVAFGSCRRIWTLQMAPAHGTVGPQFLHSGHHMSDRTLAIQQVASTLPTLIPADQTVCVSLFYMQSKMTGLEVPSSACSSRISTSPASAASLYKLLGIPRRDCVRPPSNQVLRDIRALFPGAVAILVNAAWYLWGPTNQRSKIASLHPKGRQPWPRCGQRRTCFLIITQGT